MVKISDFGTCREWNEISTQMSFVGTIAYMPPEVIRNEPCSEKVDIWSYGVVLWELLTCEIPYKEVDSSAIMWGVGNNSLHLPIPSTCPDGFKLLMKQCWSLKPRNRPPFKIILTHLDIAGGELMQKVDDKYFEQQKTWREEIHDHMKTCATNSTNIHKYEQDLIRKRQDELKHAKDIRLIYERKLERTNNLYMELSACFLHLEEREKDIQEREKQVGKPYRKIVYQFKKHHFDKIARRRFCVQSPATPDINSTTPSPSSPNSPVKASLYATLGTGQQPKSIVVQPLSSNGSVNRKKRHRRVGSGSLMTPKSSPSRDRRTQSEPDSRLKKLVDTETQTDAMDISETDISPTSPNMPPQVPKKSETQENSTDEADIPTNPVTKTTQRHVTMCLKTDENNKQYVAGIKKPGLTSDDEDEEGDIDDNMPEDTSSSQNMVTSMGTSMATSMFTSIMTGSNLSYDSSQDNLNNFRECSDDDHLDVLGRKVSELISETTSTISTVSSTATIINKNVHQCICNNKPHSDKNEYSDSNFKNNNEMPGPSKRSCSPTNDDKNLNSTKCICTTKVTNLESHDDVSPSWSDEEEDGKKFDYNFSLRRKW